MRCRTRIWQHFMCCAGELRGEGLVCRAETSSQLVDSAHHSDLIGEAKAACLCAGRFSCRRFARADARQQSGRGCGTGAHRGQRPPQCGAGAEGVPPACQRAGAVVTILTEVALGGGLWAALILQVRKLCSELGALLGCSCPPTMDVETKMQNNLSIQRFSIFETFSALLGTKKCGLSILKLTTSMSFTLCQALGLRLAGCGQGLEDMFGRILP